MWLLPDHFGLPCDKTDAFIRDAQVASLCAARSMRVVVTSVRVCRCVRQRMLIAVREDDVPFQSVVEVRTVAPTWRQVRRRCTLCLQQLTWWSLLSCD